MRTFLLALLLSSPALAGEVGLHWDAVEHPRLSGYEVRWSVPGQPGGPEMWASGVLTESRDVTVIDLECRPRPYWFSVRAVGSIDPGPWSEPLEWWPSVERIVGKGRKDCRCRGFRQIGCSLRGGPP